MEATDNHLIDDASRHLKAKGFLPNLPREAALTHMGLYLGWGMTLGMMSQTFQSEYADDVAAFKEQRLSGPHFVGRLGGMLHTSLFNDELAYFSRIYYSKVVRFYADYVHAFAKPITQARSMYVVADTWENQDHLSALLDQRFSAWQVYPPAAHRIFGEEVGVGSYQDLETVTQMALLVAADSKMSSVPISDSHFGFHFGFQVAIHYAPLSPSCPTFHREASPCGPCREDRPLH
jgi:hypothetical protein